MCDKRSSLLNENAKEPVSLAMFPQYDLTKDVRFELMKKVFGSTQLHKRHTFLNKDTERQFRAHDRQKKMVQIEFDRQKQKVAEHFFKLLNNSHIPTEDLRYSYNNWPHNYDGKPVNKQQTLEKATLECTVTLKDGKEIYTPVKSRKELPVRQRKAPKPDIDGNRNITRFPLYWEMTM